MDKSKTNTLDLKLWPSDINIYSNKMYMASEIGINTWDLDFDTGKLKNKKKLFDGMCFSVSPNSFNRLAFAAGKDGIYTVLPSSKTIRDSDIKQLNSKKCIDLEWQSTELFASTNDGVLEASYLSMPERDEFKTDKDFFYEVNNRKHKLPEVNIDREAKSSWIAGNKKYSLLINGELKITDRNESSNIQKKDINVEGRILRARTAAYGTHIETEKQLSVILGSEIFKLAHEPINWRVFPRAKNYANQVHLIHEDRIEITIIESLQDNVFGFDPDKIEK